MASVVFAFIITSTTTKRFAQVDEEMTSKLQLRSEFTVKLPDKNYMAGQDTRMYVRPFFCVLVYCKLLYVKLS
jgi:hypothetical protein